MKKLNYLLTLVIAFFISSCQKAPSPDAKLNKETSSEVEKLKLDIKNLKQKYPTITNKAPKWWVACICDGAGAWEGAQAGSLFGPWGTFGGATICGVGASAAYAWGAMAPTGSGDTEYSSISNDLEKVAILHNKILSKIVGNSTRVNYSDTLLDTLELFNVLKENFIVEWNLISNENRSINDIGITYQQFKQSIEKSISYGKSKDLELISENELETFLLDSYLTTANNVDKEQLKGFTEEYCAILENSNINLGVKNKSISFNFTYLYSNKFWY